MKFFFQKSKLQNVNFLTSESRYKVVFDISPEAVILVDIKGNYIDMNGKVDEWLGYEREKIIGTNVKDTPFMSKETRLYIMDQFRKRVSGEQIVPYDVECITKSGDIKIGRIRASVIRDDKKNPLGELILISDVTGEKGAEENLKQEKDKLNLIVNSMGEGLLLVNKDFEIEMMNMAGAELLGIKEEEALGKKWFEFATAFIGNREIPFDKRVSTVVLNKGVSVVTELEDNHFYLIKASGRKFPIVSITTPLIVDGKTTGAIKVFRDASIEKEAKIIIEERIKSGAKALKEEQTKTNFILENTGEGIVLTDAQGLITYVNPAFEKLTGYSDKDLLDKDFSEEIHAYDLKGETISPSRMSDAAAVTAHKQEMKIRIEKKDKNQIEVVVYSSPMKVDTQYFGLIRIFHDFSEDFRLQQQKDDFFSIASHELRTPLSVINGNLDTILTGYGKSQISTSDMQLLQDSEEATERLIKLVSDFLNVSRLDQGRLKYEIREVDLCFLLESVVREMTALCKKKKINLSFKCDSNPKHKIVMADEGLLREILVNLIGNSLKFTDRGEIEIAHGMKDDMSIITVSDTGMGIAADKQDLLFQRFQQAMERTLARQAGGTGLGLYISREFARVMGGDLYLVKSEEGKGSTFELKVPLVKK